MPDAPDPIAVRLDRLAARWVAKANSRAEVGIGRVHAHANLAVTETLKRTPSGRATIRKASNSRSYAAAEADLDDLWSTLVGPSVTSLKGLIRDARADLYTVAFRYYVGHYEEPFSVGKDAVPSADQIRFVRGVVLHGMDLRTEIGGAIVRLKRSLSAAIEVAAREGSTPTHTLSTLDGWRVQSLNAIQTTCRLALSDSRSVAEALAGTYAVKPEYRTDIPL